MDNLLLTKIFNTFNKKDQQILLRSILCSKILQKTLEDEELINFFTNTSSTISQYTPLNIALFLSYPHENLIQEDLIEFTKSHIKELSIKGEDALRRINLQIGFKPGIKDALNISAFISEKSCENGSKSKNSLIWKSLKIEENKIDFWSHVLAILAKLNDDPKNYYKEISGIKPQSDFFEAIISSFLMNLMEDDEIEKISLDILEKQSIGFCIKYLIKIKKKGLDQICENLAKSIIPSQHSNPILSETNEILFNIYDWKDIGKIGNFIQDYALLKYFAGETEDAETLLRKTLKIFDLQKELIFRFQEELNQNNEKRNELKNNVEQEILPELNFASRALPITPYKNLKELIAHGTYDQAEKIISDLKNNGVIEPSLYLLSSDLYTMQGGYIQGLREILIADSLEPLDLNGKKKIAKLFLLNNKGQEAFDLFSTITKTNADNTSENLEEYCLYALKSGHYVEVLGIIEGQEVSNKKNERVLLFGAESAFILGKFELSMNLLYQVIELKKDLPQAWILLSRIQEKNGEKEKALESILTGLKYCPESQSLLFSAAKLYQSSGNIGLADQSIIELVKSPLESVEEVIEISKFLIQCHKQQFTEELLLKANKIWPKNVLILEDLSYVYLQKGKYTDVIKLLGDFISFLDIEGIKTLLFALFNSREDLFPIQAKIVNVDYLERIKKILTKILAESTEDPWVNLFNSIYLLLTKEYQSAYDILVKFLSNNKNAKNDLFWKYQIALGQLFLEIGKPESAIAIFQELANSHSFVFEIFQFLSDAFYSCGLKEKAFNKIMEGFDSAQSVEKYIPWLAEFIVEIGKEKEVLAQLKQKEVENKINFNDYLLWGFLEKDDKKNIEKIIGVFQNKKLNFVQTKLVFQLLMILKLFSLAENLVNEMKFDYDEERINISLLKAVLYYQLERFPEAENELTICMGNKKEINFELLFLLDVLEKTKNIEYKNNLLKQYFQNEKILNQFSNIYQSPEIEEVRHVLPQSWKKLLTNTNACLDLIINVLLENQNYHTVLEQLEKMLFTTNSSDELVFKTIEIARDHLEFDKFYQILDRAKNDEGRNNNNNEDNRALALQCYQLEIYLLHNEELKAAELLNKLIPKNEDNLWLQSIQSRLLLREGDIENSKKIYYNIKTNIENPEIWLMESALENKDYEGFLEYIVKNHENGRITPFIVWLFLKGKAELFKQRQIADQLQSIFFENKIFEKINDVEDKLSAKIVLFEKEYPLIKEWSKLNKTIESNQLAQTTIINNLSSSFMAFIHYKTQNINELKNIIEREPENSEINFLMALTLLYVNIDESKKYFLKAISKDSNNSFHFAGLASLEKKNGNLQEFLLLMEKALELSPEEKIWRKSVVEASEKLSNWDKVIFHGNHLISNNQRDDSVLISVIHGYVQKGEYAIPNDLINKIQLKPDDSFEILIILARSALSNKNYKNAIDLLNKARKLNPNSVLPLVILSELSLELQQNEKAFEYATQAVEIDPTDAQANLALANVINKINGSDAAIDFLTSIIGKGIQSNLILCRAAELLKVVKGSEAALEFLKAHYINDDKVLTQLAFYEMEIGHESEAENYALKSLSNRPGQPDLLKLLGKIEMHKGNLDQSIKYFSDAITFNPTDVENFILSSDLYIQRREVEKAIEVLNQGIRLNSHDWKLYQHAGKLYWNIKNYQKAEEYFQLAQQLNPGNKQIDKQLAILRTMNIIYSN